jgi:hypothetical protein
MCIALCHSLTRIDDIFTAAMYRTLGSQWATALCAFLTLIFFPLPFYLFFRYGARECNRHFPRDVLTKNRNRLTARIKIRTAALMFSFLEFSYLSYNHAFAITVYTERVRFTREIERRASKMNPSRKNYFETKLNFLIFDPQRHNNPLSLSQLG